MKTKMESGYSLFSVSGSLTNTVCSFYPLKTNPSKVWTFNGKGMK